jgi:xanthine dehydrogenase/oxidase
MAIITIESLGKVKDKIHPIQEILSKNNSTQCGFCSPGFVMSLYSLIRSNSNPSQEDIEDYLEGNLCRCTGYFPILGKKTN